MYTPVQEVTFAHTGILLYTIQILGFNSYTHWVMESPIRRNCDSGENSVSSGKPENV